MSLRQTLLLVICLTCGIALSSCSQEEPIADIPANSEESSRLRTESISTQAEANLLLARYLILDERKREYRLEITKEDALRLGLTESMYENAVNEIEEANRLIKMYDNEAPYELLLIDPKQEMTEETMLRSTEAGVIHTDDNQWGYASFSSVIREAKGVRFLCRSAVALLPVYNCFTRWAEKTKTGSAVGAIGVNTEIKVPMAVAGSYASIRLGFKTSDSNGGTASWRIYK